MTEEEKEAIRYLKQIQQDFLNSAKQRRENGEYTGYGTLEDVDKLSAFEIGIVLNLIQKRQKELEKKDKQIDLMAKDLLTCGFDWIDFGKATGDFNKDKEKLKQYFKKQAEEV